MKSHVVLVVFLVGAMAGFVALLGANLIPLTELRPLTVILTGEQAAGPRLFLGGVHIHHFWFGLFLMGVGALAFSKSQILGALILGFGFFWFLDEVPDMLSGGWKFVLGGV